MLLYDTAEGGPSDVLYCVICGRACRALDEYDACSEKCDLETVRRFIALGHNHDPLDPPDGRRPCAVCDVKRAERFEESD